MRRTRTWRGEIGNLSLNKKVFYIHFLNLSQIDFFLCDLLSLKTFRMSREKILQSWQKNINCSVARGRKLKISLYRPMLRPKRRSKVLFHLLIIGTKRFCKFRMNRQELNRHSEC